MDNFLSIEANLIFPPKNNNTFYLVSLRDLEYKKMPIKNYYIYDVSILKENESEIKAICEALNVKAIINMNPMLFEDVAYTAVNSMLNDVKHKRFVDTRRCYDNACNVSSQLVSFFIHSAMASDGFAKLKQEGVCFDMHIHRCIKLAQKSSFTQKHRDFCKTFGIEYDVDGIIPLYIHEGA